MPKRNGQNPIRMDKNSKKQERGKFGASSPEQLRTDGVIQCPDCNADILPKPGFRAKSLKCPKCGASAVK
jgi:DNA-directed RNA polymerase subunit RPC12/RpoP